MSVTAHCLVKNEEVFIKYALLSVVDFVDRILVYDTGSTDRTPEIVRELVQKYPAKILFEEKGECDKKQHTLLRQEMLDRTTTDWFMILDGDEVWTRRGMEEAVRWMNTPNTIECLMAPFYLCVGDIFHTTRRKGSIRLLDKIGYFYPRFMKITKGIHWSGDYNEDTILTAEKQVFFTYENSYFLESRYWHMTHLVRSSTDGNDYSSGGTRSAKRKLTYFLIGKKITEPVPEVFEHGDFQHLPFFPSLINFVKLLYRRLRNLF